MNNIAKYSFLISIMYVLMSCSSSKESLNYFDNVDSLIIASSSIGNNAYGLKIVPEDELKITIHSEVPEATAMYNLPLANVVDSREVKTSSNPSVQTYTVAKDGYVNIPVIGKLYVEGKTLDEVENLVYEMVSKHVENPYVSVKLWNYRVNVLGEVNHPKVIWVNKERYTILDAIGDAGDLTAYGKRDNILLIREENGVKKIHKLNLNDVALLESPYFYLQQNDVIIVKANKVKEDNSMYNQNNGFKLSVITTIVSAISVIASLVIAIAIK